MASAIGLVAFMVGTCAPSAGSSPASTLLVGPTSPPPIASSTLTTRPTSGPTDWPTPELCPTDVPAATGPEVAITNADVKLRAPTGWTPADIEAYRTQLLQLVAAINDPALTKMGEWQGGLIDSNVMRAAASGRSQPSGAQTYVIVSVLPQAADLRAVVDARLVDETTNGLPVTVVELKPTDLPIGPGYCIGMISNGAVGTPSQTIEYIAALADGRAISTGATAPGGDIPFADVVRSVALTLDAS